MYKVTDASGFSCYFTRKSGHGFTIPEIKKTAKAYARKVKGKLYLDTSTTRTYRFTKDGKDVFPRYILITDY